jgi:hypothetical protein
MYVCFGERQFAMFEKSQDGIVKHDLRAFYGSTDHGILLVKRPSYALSFQTLRATDHRILLVKKSLVKLCGSLRPFEPFQKQKTFPPWKLYWSPQTTHNCNPSRHRCAVDRHGHRKQIDTSGSETGADLEQK